MFSGFQRSFWISYRRFQNLQTTSVSDKKWIWDDAFSSARTDKRTGASEGNLFTPPLLYHINTFCSNVQSSCVVNEKFIFTFIFMLGQNLILIVVVKIYWNVTIEVFFYWSNFSFLGKILWCPSWLKEKVIHYPLTLSSSLEIRKAKICTQPMSEDIVSFYIYDCLVLEHSYVCEGCISVTWVVHLLHYYSCPVRIAAFPWICGIIRLPHLNQSVLACSQV